MTAGLYNERLNNRKKVTSNCRCSIQPLPFSYAFPLCWRNHPTLEIENVKRFAKLAAFYTHTYQQVIHNLWISPDFHNMQPLQKSRARPKKLIKPQVSHVTGYPQPTALFTAGCRIFGDNPKIKKACGGKIAECDCSFHTPVDNAVDLFRSGRRRTWRGRWRRRRRSVWRRRR